MDAKRKIHVVKGHSDNVALVVHPGLVFATVVAKNVVSWVVKETMEKYIETESKIRHRELMEYIGNSMRATVEAELVDEYMGKVQGCTQLLKDFHANPKDENRYMPQTVVTEMTQAAFVLKEKSVGSLGGYIGPCNLVLTGHLLLGNKPAARYFVKSMYCPTLEFIHAVRGHVRDRVEGCECTTIIGRGGRKWRCTYTVDGEGRNNEEYRSSRAMNKCRKRFNDSRNELLNEANTNYINAIESIVQTWSGFFDKNEKGEIIYPEC